MGRTIFSEPLQFYTVVPENWPTHARVIQLGSVSAALLGNDTFFRIRQRGILIVFLSLCCVTRMRVTVHSTLAPCSPARLTSIPAVFPLLGAPWYPKDLRNGSVSSFSSWCLSSFLSSPKLALGDGGDGVVLRNPTFLNSCSLSPVSSHY